LDLQGNKRIGKAGLQARVEDGDIILPLNAGLKRALPELGLQQLPNCA
jgi:hypothetical protein